MSAARASGAANSLPSCVAVLRLFAVIFSLRWITRWQLQPRARETAATGRSGAVAQGRQKKRKNDPPGEALTNASSRCRSRCGI